MIKLTKINIVTGYKIEYIRRFVEFVKENHDVEICPVLESMHQRDAADAADIFISVLNKQIGFKLVCTFYEEFILRCRRRIAEGILNNDDFKMFFVEVEDDDQIEYKEFTFNEYGDFVEGDGWPFDFFKTCYDDVCAINRARRKKEENNEC